MKRLIWMAGILLLWSPVQAQENRITVDAGVSLGEISPYVYGQFIEYMGRCIDGGVFDEGSPLSDSRGFRKDVLEKVKELSPTILRFPGGTVAKTLHWEDGVGPRQQRRARKNIIWGGVNDFHFGTCEFIEYCREIGAEPCLVVNISTGTPDEAAGWVEYCNGTEDTYYANLRRSHGYPEPFNVKYWALGNEEGAEPDAGRHQNPAKYVEDVWHFIKLMKLTDPSIKLIANGEGGSMAWNKTVLDGLGNAVDYISYHHYVKTAENDGPYSLFRSIGAADRGLRSLGGFIRENYPDSVRDWQMWYRFPHRADRIRIAFDEWGIWEDGEPPYGTTNTYEWRHGLAAAYFLNAIHRNADHVGMANWAQMVNILAPIMTSGTASVRQTTFFPLKEYRAKGLKECVSAEAVSPAVDAGVSSLDVSATIDRESGKLNLFVVNLNPGELATRLDFRNCPAMRLVRTTVLSAPSIDAKNTLDAPDRNVVGVTTAKHSGRSDRMTFKGESVTICEFEFGRN